MKLIALRDFRNTHELEIADALHEKHVHKGAVFSIGGTDAKGNEIPFDKLLKRDQELVALLSYAKCIGNGADTELVKRIQKEAAEEAKSIAEAKKTLMSAGSAADIIKQLVDALRALRAEPAIK